MKFTEFYFDQFWVVNFKFDCFTDVVNDEVMFDLDLDAITLNNVWVLSRRNFFAIFSVDCVFSMFCHLCSKIIVSLDQGIPGFSVFDERINIPCVDLISWNDFDCGLNFLIDDFVWVTNFLLIDKMFLISFVFELSFDFGCSFDKNFPFFSLVLELLAVDFDFCDFVGAEFFEKPGSDVRSWLLEVFCNFGKLQLPMTPF